MTFCFFLGCRNHVRNRRRQYESTSLNPQDEVIFQNQNVSDIFQETPNAGMKFNSEGELYDFYKKYAFETGFGTRKSSVRKKG